MKNPLCIPIVGQKTSNLSKNTILWAKKVNPLGKNKHKFGQYNTDGGWGENGGSTLGKT